LEYPCIPTDTACGPDIKPGKHDKENFVLLMKEFKKLTGNSLELSIATSATEDKAKALDFPELNKILDFYNIMDYDFTSGSWGDEYTGH